MPNLDELKSEVEESKDYKHLDQVEWEARIKHRAVDTKFDYALQNLEDMYVQKISSIRDSLRGDWSFSLVPYSDSGDRLKTPKELGDEMAKELSYSLQKDTRLLDKFACVIKEKELRVNELVTRTPHHTTYYADYVNGDDSNSGEDWDGDEWKTIHKYTTVTVRSPGDILKLRADITWLYGAGGENQNIVFDEDGTVDDWIKIKGCDSVDDPWGDASDVAPIIDFESIDRYCYWDQDNYWMVENVVFENGSTRNIYCNFVRELYLKDCEIKTVGTVALRNYMSSVVAENCQFFGASYNIYCIRGRVHLKGGAVHKGGGVSWYGVAMYGGIFLAEDTVFGSPYAHTLGDIYFIEGAGVAFLHNCLLDSPARIKYHTTQATHGAAFEEDADQVFEAHRATYLNGTIERNTVVVRTGGADSSALMQPNAVCGPNFPLKVRGDFDTAGDFRIWCPAIETTITIYMRRYEDWTVEPDASELYVQASYLSNGASAARALSTASIQDLPDSDAWTAFTTTFTPAREGWVYITVSLEKYQSGKGVYVDIKPMVS